MDLRPDVIVIDLDNTMYAYEPCDRAGKVLVELELKIRLGLERKDWQRAYEDSKISVKARLGKVASSHSRLEYFKGMFENLGMTSQLDLALQLEGLYWGEFIRQIGKIDGLDRFLEVAREYGIPVVVATDLTTGVQIRKLHKLGILDMISGLVTSEGVGADKPDTGFSVYVSEQLGIKGKNFWVVGDDEEKDKKLAEVWPGAVFKHLSASAPSANDFTRLSKALEEICR